MEIISNVFYLHYEVDSSKLADALLHSFLQALNVPDVHRSDPEDFSTISRSGNIFCYSLGLRDLSPNYTGIGAEVDKCSDLGTADGA